MIIIVWGSYFILFLGLASQHRNCGSTTSKSWGDVLNASSIWTQPFETGSHIFDCRGQPTLSLKGQMVSILVLWTIRSLAALWPCHSSIRAVTVHMCNMQMNETSCILIKLYLQNGMSGWVWPARAGVLLKALKQIVAIKIESKHGDIFWLSNYWFA